MLLPNVVTHGIQQVCLTHTGGSADKERIVTLGPGIFGDAKARCVGELVVTTDHERVEGVVGRQNVTTTAVGRNRLRRIGDGSLIHGFFEGRGALGFEAALLPRDPEFDLKRLRVNR